MKAAKVQKIRADFDCIAQFDQGGWNHNNHYHGFLLQHLPRNLRFGLDIGCGTGEFARILAKQAQHVTAIDLSPRTIELAKLYSAKYQNIDFQVADILQWQLPANRYDAIVSIATLHHIQIEDLLPKLKIALKPGGKLIILDLLQHSTINDYISDLIAVPLNWLYQVLKNRHIHKSPEALAAMREHARTDQYFTLAQAKTIYAKFLPGSIVRKHLFWRYSVIWQNAAQ